jgi:chromosome segregation ATPase
VQGALIAFFLGKMRESQVGAKALFDSYQGFQATLIEQFRLHQEQSLATLGRRMDDFEEFGSGSATDRARLNVRLEQVERNTAGVQALGMDMAGQRERAKAEHEHQNRELESIKRELKNIHAQIRNLATGTANSSRVIPSTDA